MASALQAGATIGPPPAVVSRLATFATDREPKLRDPSTGREMMSTHVDQDGTWDLRLTADGERLFARGDHFTHCLDFDRAE